MLGKYKLFLRWWLSITLMTAGGAICWNLGLFNEIWDKDVTKISFLILSLFAYMSAWCGWKTWKITQLSNQIVPSVTDEERSNKIEQLSEIGWFSSDQFLTMGMIGTLIGFIVMFGVGFATLDMGNAKSAQIVLQNMAVGMSTALYTTLVGLVCSSLLKIQYFNLKLGLDEINK